MLRNGRMFRAAGADKNARVYARTRCSKTRRYICALDADKRGSVYLHQVFKNGEMNKNLEMFQKAEVVNAKVDGQRSGKVEIIGLAGLCCALDCDLELSLG